VKNKNIGEQSSMFAPTFLLGVDCPGDIDASGEHRWAKQHTA